MEAWEYNGLGSRKKVGRGEPSFLRAKNTHGENYDRMVALRGEDEGIYEPVYSTNIGHSGERTKMVRALSAEMSGSKMALNKDKEERKQEC